MIYVLKFGIISLFNDWFYFIDNKKRVIVCFFY